MVVVDRHPRAPAADEVIGPTGNCAPHRQHPLRDAPIELIIEAPPCAVDETAIGVADLNLWSAVSLEAVAIRSVVRHVEHAMEETDVRSVDLTFSSLQPVAPVKPSRGMHMALLQCQALHARQFRHKLS